MTPLAEISKKEAYEQKATAQLLLWNARLQSGWLTRRRRRMLKRHEIIKRLNTAWESLERFRRSDDDDFDRWQDVEESIGGVRRAMAY